MLTITLYYIHTYENTENIVLNKKSSSYQKHTNALYQTFHGWEMVMLILM